MCYSCWEPLENWWTWEDFSWFEYVKPAENPMYLLVDGHIELSMETCLVCMGDKTDDHFTHEYRPYYEAIVYEDENKFIVIPELGGAIPVRSFYDLDSVSYDVRIPIDCRSCVNYRTFECRPLMNAISDIHYMLETNGPDSDEDIGASGYNIVPCDNFDLNHNISFDNIDDLDIWIETMQKNYGLNHLYGLRQFSRSIVLGYQDFQYEDDLIEQLAEITSANESHDNDDRDENDYYAVSLDQLHDI